MIGGVLNIAVLVKEKVEQPANRLSESWGKSLNAVATPKAPAPLSTSAANHFAAINGVHPGVIIGQADVGAPSDVVRTGLGDDVDQIVKQSPTLALTLENFRKKVIQ